MKKILDSKQYDIFIFNNYCSCKYSTNCIKSLRFCTRNHIFNLFNLNKFDQNLKHFLKWIIHFVVECLTYVQANTKLQLYNC